MPGIAGVNDVELNSVGYKLANQPRTGRPIYSRDEAPQFVNRNASGDSFYRDATFWSHWVQLTWQNGAKQEFFNDAGRFWKNAATNPTESEKLELSRITQTFPTVSAGEPRSMGHREGASKRLYMGLSSGNVYVYPCAQTAVCAWYYEAASVSGSINQLYGTTSGETTVVMWGTTGIIGDNDRNTPSIGLVKLTGSDPGTWGTQIVDSAVARPSISVAKYGDNLYVGAGDEGRIYKSTDEGTTWDKDKVLATFAYPWALKEYAGYLFIGGGKPYGGGNIDESNFNGELWRYDGVSYDLVAPFHWTEVTALEVYNGTLFIGTYHGEIFIYDLSSLDKLFEIPGKPRINDMDTVDDKLYINTAQNSDGSTWIFDRRGFHRPIDVSTHARNSDFTLNNYFMVNYDTAPVTTYQNFTTKYYQPGGTLQTSYFDANLPSLNKLWKETTLQWDDLPDSTSMKVEYKFAEDDSFTTLGTISASANSREYTIPYPSGTFSKQLSLQYTLSTSVSTSTPTLRRSITKYRTMPDFYYRWQLGIDTSDKIQYLDGSYATSSGRDFQSKLLGDKRTKSIFPFKDIDYTSAKIKGSLAASAATIPIFSDPTDLFPLQGRLRIPGTNEEVTYTSANTSAFTGVSRGIKMTTPTSAATSATIDNSYRVIFDEIDSQQFHLNLLADRIENITPVTLLEI